MLPALLRGPQLKLALLPFGIRPRRSVINIGTFRQLARSSATAFRWNVFVQAPATLPKVLAASGGIITGSDRAVPLVVVEIVRHGSLLRSEQDCQER
jgi:hypothetical protein